MSVFDDNLDTIRLEFKKKLSWFEEEFENHFGNKTTNITKEDIKLANTLMDRLSETLNEYASKYDYDELLKLLVEKMSQIEDRYPEIFFELKIKF